MQAFWNMNRSLCKMCTLNQRPWYLIWISSRVALLSYILSKGMFCEVLFSKTSSACSTFSFFDSSLLTGMRMYLTAFSLFISLTDTNTEYFLMCFPVAFFLPLETFVQILCPFLSYIFFFRYWNLDDILCGVLIFTNVFLIVLHQLHDNIFRIHSPFHVLWCLYMHINLSLYHFVSIN